MILAPVGKPRATSSAATESIVSRRSTISVRSLAPLPQGSGRRVGGDIVADLDERDGAASRRQRHDAVLDTSVHAHQDRKRAVWAQRHKT